VNKGSSVKRLSVALLEITGTLTTITAAVV